MKIYRNTFVFIFFALLTIDVFEKKNAENRYFCATRAKFALNSNEHRFSIYIDNWKIIKKILVSFDRSISNDRTTTTTKKHQSVMIRHHSIFFFQEKILLILRFFFVLRINIVISFNVTTKETTTTKKRTKTIFTKTKRARKIFRIVFLTKTLKKKF